MTDARKKPGVAFWLAVAATVTLFYVLSSGPVNWIALKGYLPDGAGTFIYAPVLWIVERCPESTQTAFVRWLSLWHPGDWDETFQEQLGEELAKEMFKGMAEDFAALGGTEDEENGEGMNPTDEASRRTFSLPTKDGTLVVTVNDPDIAVQLFKEEGKIEIARKGESGPMTISVDSEKHTLKMQSGRNTFFAAKVEITPGSKQGITAKLVPLGDEVEEVEAPSDP